MRPSVLAFAALMEAKLRENDHKGGWQHDGTEALIKRLRQEADELEAITETSGAWCSSPPFAVLDAAARLRIGREAADVANFAMMIADVCGALATAPLGTTTCVMCGGDGRVWVGQGPPKPRKYSWWKPCPNCAAPLGTTTVLTCRVCGCATSACQWATNDTCEHSGRSTPCTTPAAPLGPVTPGGLK